MGNHNIPANTFFSGSPEIRIRCIKQKDAFVSETKKRAEEEPNKGFEMNCFQRLASDKERDGHLVRLTGVAEMESFLREMGSSATVWYHGKKKAWVEGLGPTSHPCGMLSYNDKWWRYFWDNAHLSRLGHERRDQESCVPPELKDKSEHTFACQRLNCIYCNGWYDNTIEQVFGRTGGEKSGFGPWVEGLRNISS